jgi:predicted DNA-binding transcriptional regulator YafY
MMRIETRFTVFSCVVGGCLWPHATSNTGQNPPGIGGILRTMSRPVSRVLALLELLQAGGTRTVAELAGRLGVDERTVRRYADHLLDLDVPVESVRGRYGGYRLAPGYRLPPLMLSDDEALAVLLGLAAGRRTGITAAAGTAAETASAKIRRVLPERLRSRLDAVLGSLTSTAPPDDLPAPEAAVLLPVADAVRHHRPVAIRYTDAGGRRSERTVHPYGLVAHAGRWYVTATDPAAGEDRTFRLDRVGGVRILPGSFEPPEGPDPAQRVLTGLATAPYRHEVRLRVRGRAELIRSRLPAGVAIVTPVSGSAPSASGAEEETGTWCLVEIRAERLDWLPGVLAALDLPFLIERPDELRDLVAALAGRLASSARRTSSG